MRGIYGITVFLIVVLMWLIGLSIVELAQITVDMIEGILQWATTEFDI